MAKKTKIVDPRILALNEWLCYYTEQKKQAEKRIKEIKKKLLVIKSQADDPPDKIINGKPWWNVGGHRKNG